MSNSNLKRPKGTEEEQLDVVDYFERFADWTEKNAKIIVLGFLGFTLAVAAFWGVSAMKTNALNTAAHETGVVNRRIDLLEKAVAEAKDKTSQDFEKNKNTEILSIHSEALKAVEKNSDRSVADFTAVRWASYLLKEDKKDMALEMLSKTKPSAARELSATVLFLKASIYTGEKKIEESMAEYDKVMAEKSWFVFHAEAMIQKGALLESKGDMDGAIALFDQAKNLKKETAGKESGFSKDAAKYKRLLQIKKNNPELFKQG